MEKDTTKNMAIAIVINFCTIVEQMYMRDKIDIYQDKFKNYFMDSVDDLIGFFSSEFNIKHEDYKQVVNDMIQTLDPENHNIIFAKTPNIKQ